MAKSAKKHKEKKPTISEESSTPPTAVSSSSNLFASLFGVIPEENSKGSIFSDDNPFRRKPGNSSQTPVEQKQDLGSGFGSPNAEKNGVFEDSNGSPSELRKRKRSKEKEEGSNGGGSGGDDTKWIEEEKVETKKLKNDESGKEGNGMIDGERNKKKKRKRDEVEAEYEARRYGVELKEDENGVVGRKRKKMESLEDVIIESKEGFDDESKLLRTVFVGNLPLKIKKKVLIREFGKFGEVESVRIRSIPLNDSKLPRKGAIIKKQISETADSVHAYVVFKTEEAAQASLAHNMAVVDGNHIRVDRACPPRKKLKAGDTPLYDQKRTVFVGNLPFDVKDEELYQLFNDIEALDSNIEAIRIVRDPGTSLGKGIAYVLFKTTEAADMVVKRRRLKLRDRDLRLYHAKAETTPSKRQNPFLAEANTPPTKKSGVNPRLTLPGNEIKSRGDLPYQGLRGSKNGVQKKAYVVENLITSSQKVSVKKQRTFKRPAVADRKSKALDAKQLAFKRKQENQTPNSKGRKKARKST